MVFFSWKGWCYMSDVKIRIHEGYVETRFGMDCVYILDDPLKPEYTKEIEIEKALICEYGLEIATEKDNVESPYVTEDGDWAYFEYMKTYDVKIPDSIVERIRKEI